MSIYSSYRFLFQGLLALFAALYGCSGSKNSIVSAQVANSNCNQQEAYRYEKSELPKPFYEIYLDSTLTTRFSDQPLHVANAFGLLGILSDFIYALKRYEQERSLTNRLDLIELRQKIHKRISFAALEISAISSELVCEKERAELIANYLKGKEEDAGTKLTVGAIVVGGAGAIAAGVLLAKNYEGNSAELIGIGTGIVEASLGVMILMNKRKLEYNHPRNALREIWNGDEVSNIFPASVWYYLNYKNPQKDEESLRQQLINRWLGFGDFAEVKENNKAEVYRLFFGNGGKYGSEELANRANMYDQIEAQINLMRQDLKQLAIELEEIDPQKAN